MDLGRLEKRIKSSRYQQYRPKSAVRVEDPITGRIVILNPNREVRHSELLGQRRDRLKKREDCYYCKGETTSTLFYIDDSMRVRIPEESASLEAGLAFLKTRDRNRIDSYYKMVRKNSRHTLPAGRWLTRTFLNLVPPMTRYPELNLVTAVSPEHHYKQMHQLPLRTLTATIISWQVIEEFSAAVALETVPFINGGKRPESGQSIFCFHSQVYVTKTPKLYEEIARRRSRRGCGVCQILRRRSLTVYSNEGFKVLVHPAPSRNHSLLIAARDCRTGLNQVNAGLLADALKVALTGLELLTGGIPAYNVAVRCGTAGHLHAEFVPKTETNVPAGFEEASGVTIITERPVKVSELLKKLLS